MQVTLTLLSSRSPTSPQTFKNIHSALQAAHDKEGSLYEEDDGELNLVYSSSWDVCLRRAAWRTLRSSYGLSPYDRKALPRELVENTIGPDFEVK